MIIKELIYIRYRLRYGNVCINIHVTFKIRLFINETRYFVTIFIFRSIFSRMLSIIFDIRDRMVIK